MRELFQMVWFIYRKPELVITRRSEGLEETTKKEYEDPKSLFGKIKNDLLIICNSRETILNGR